MMSFVTFLSVRLFSMPQIPITPGMLRFDVGCGRPNVR